jgi:CrcB protein
MISYYVATGIGGAIGAIARVALSRVLPITFMEIPLPILFINIIGCFIMGLLTEFMALYWSVSESVRYLLISGFLGGFTTFSSFALEFGLLFEKNLQLSAMIYATFSVVLSLIFFFIGVKFVRIFI